MEKGLPVANHAAAASIVIPTLNEEKYLPLLLNSLKEVGVPVDIIVVDGNSEDGTVRVVEEFESSFAGTSSLRLIRSRERGIALQRNMGAAHARNKILIFCDADIIIPSSDAYATLIREFAKRKYAVAAPRLIPIESGITFKIFYRTFYVTQCILLLFGRPYFAGSYLITTMEAFTKIGGFDNNVVLGEDVDYSLRASKVGPYGLFNIPFPVSARRVIKYGYGWMFAELPNLFRFFLTGRVIPETIFYPFGEFGGHSAHYVTKNKGTSKT